MNVRIGKRPLGDAPEEVRDAWVGLVLPLYAPQPRAALRRTEQVPRPGPRGKIADALQKAFGKPRFPQGFVVEVAPALELLAKSNPFAAEWWRNNRAELLKPNACFLFDEACGTVEE